MAQETLETLDLSETQLASLAGMFSEMDRANTQIDLFKGTLDDIRARAVEELGIKKTDFNYLYGEFSKETATNQSFRAEAAILLVDKAKEAKRRASKA